MVKYKQKRKRGAERLISTEQVVGITIVNKISNSPRLYPIAGYSVGIGLLILSLEFSRFA